MTGASATLLIVSIISLNIVWGYPWTGMFAGSVSMLLVGLTINRVMHPKLKIGFSLPSSSPAGEFFSLTTHVSNARALPAIDVGIEFARPTRRRRSRHRREDSFESQTEVQWINAIQPSKHVDLSSTIRFNERGVHPLPDIVVTSMFPFHLFRSVKRIPSEALIAITPRPATGNEDPFSREMLSALGGWSHRLLAGDALDYTGSREYQTGMPVRRWDFASWARLGRPIVREFQSPSIQAVTLIVDVASGGQGGSGAQGGSGGTKTDSEAIETLLSIAATAIIELSRKMVHVRLHVTSEDPGVITEMDSAGVSGDSESLLIRLAAAEEITIETAEQNARIVLDHVGRLPVLVLTLNPDAERWQNLPGSVTILRSDLASSGVPSPAMDRHSPREDSAVSDLASTARGVDEAAASLGTEGVRS